MYSKLAALALVLVVATPDANAWLLREPNVDPACLISNPTQPFRLFESGSINVVLHLTPCPGITLLNDLDGDNLVDTQTCDTIGPIASLQIIDAMDAVHAAIEAIPGVDLNFTFSLDTINAFTFGTAEGDATPTLHVGFVVDPSVINGAAAVLVNAFPTGDCTYTEEQMVILDPTQQAWTYAEPQDLGIPWYMAGQFMTGLRSFRTVYMHELMHALGFKHVTQTYSMLNNQDRPFFDGPNDTAVQPLPDDVSALRFAYPDPAFTGDASMLLANTWLNKNAAVAAGSPGPQLFNCNPSRGASYADKFGGTSGGTFTDPDGIPTCGLCGSQPGTTIMCPGDDVHATVTIANTGTDDLDLELELWFSVDDQLSLDDVPSSTRPTAFVDAETGVNRRRTYEVPGDLAPGAYFVISRVIGSPVGGGGDLDEKITLRGTIEIDCTQPAKLCRLPITFLPGPKFPGPNFPPEGGPDLPPVFDQKFPGNPPFLGDTDGPKP